MSSWLKRLGFKGPKPPALEASTAQANAEPITIQHAQFQRPSSSGGTIIEDIFVNPDDQSPVAAINVSRLLNSEQLSMDLVVRRRRSEELGQKIQACGLYFGGMSSGLDHLKDTLKDLDVEHDEYSATILAHSGPIEEKKHLISQRAKKIIKQFKETDLLSPNTAVRDALIEAMSSVLKGHASLPINDDEYTKIR